MPNSCVDCDCASWKTIVTVTFVGTLKYCARKEGTVLGSVGERFGCTKDELTGGKSEKFVTSSFIIPNVHHI